MSTAFIDTAEARETSPEILEACLYVAGGDEYEADRIWDAPAESEALAVWERVTRNGQIPSTDFCWASLGSDWARAMGIKE